MWTAIPSARRLPSMVPVVCLLVMPAGVFAIPWLAAMLAHGEHLSHSAQIGVIAATVALQWLLYVIGLRSIYHLGTHCPPPATTAGRWISIVGGAGFVIGGAIWCVLCSGFLFVVTAYPW